MPETSDASSALCASVVCGAMLWRLFLGSWIEEAKRCRAEGKPRPQLMPAMAVPTLFTMLGLYGFLG